MVNKQKIHKLIKEFKDLKKFFKYIRSVFDFDKIVKEQKDARKKVTYSTTKIFKIVFWAVVLRIKSFNMLEQMINFGCFRAIFKTNTKLPSIDTISNTIAKWDIKILNESFKRIIRILFWKKILKKGKIDGYRVVAVDGTTINISKNRKCKDCVRMPGGYGHKAVVAMTIGENTNYVVNFVDLKVKPVKENDTKEEKVSKAEGEQTGVKQILDELGNEIDILVGDSLYFTAPFFKEVQKKGKHAVVRLEDGRRNIYKEIQDYSVKNIRDGEFKLDVNKSQKVEVSYWCRDSKIEDSTISIENPEKNMDIRIYKFIEVVETKIKENIEYKFREIIAGTTDKNMKPETVLKIIHKRWYIENTCFHQLKSYCNLEHCFRHSRKAINTMLNIMFMSYNLVQSFLFTELEKFEEKFNKKKITISWFIKELELSLTILSFMIKCKAIDANFLYT